MSSTQMSDEHAARILAAATVDLTLEVVLIRYAADIVEREQGKTPEEAFNVGSLHMETGRR